MDKNPYRQKARAAGVCIDLPPAPIAHRSRRLRRTMTIVRQPLPSWGERQQAAGDKGLCKTCLSIPAKPNRSECRECAKKRLGNQNKIKAARIAKGMCGTCGKEPLVSKTLGEKCLKSVTDYVARRRALWKAASCCLHCGAETFKTRTCAKCLERTAPHVAHKEIEILSMTDIAENALVCDGLYCMSEPIFREQISAIVRQVFAKLDPRVRFILTARFVQGYTEAEVAESQNVTRERIRQIETVALYKLRFTLAKYVGLDTPPWLTQAAQILKYEAQQNRETKTA